MLLLAAYGGLIVSLLASVLYLIQERRLKTKLGSPRPLPVIDMPLETIDQIALKTLLFGLPCMTGGLLIGTLMAQADYGVRYFADPKILLTFGLWIAYVASIFIRRSSGSSWGRRAVYLSSLVVLVVLFVWGGGTSSPSSTSSRPHESDHPAASHLRIRQSQPPSALARPRARWCLSGWITRPPPSKFSGAGSAVR